VAGHGRVAWSWTPAQEERRATAPATV